MPWEPVVIGTAVFLTQYVATKALDGISRTVSGLPRVFVESRGPFSNRTLADRFLRLSSRELLEFYSAEPPLVLELAGQTYALPVVMVHGPKNNGDLSSQDLLFSLSHEQFVPGPRLDAWRLPVRAFAERDKRLFDGRVVRLAGLRQEKDATRVSLCPAAYFDALATNFAMDHRPDGRSESLREFLHGRDRKLGVLTEDNLVNHAGVVCMLETTDGMLVGQRRSGKVANRPKSLSASVSGAVNYTDLRTSSEQGEFSVSKFAHAVFRETLEELGVETESIAYLGLVRELVRGGKPEFYFYARTASSFAEVIGTHKQAEGRAESSSVEGFEFHSDRVTREESQRYRFQERVSKILESRGDVANLTFIVGTLLAAGRSLRCAS